MEEQHKKLSQVRKGSRDQMSYKSEDVNRQTVQFHLLQFLDFGFLITSLVSSNFSHKSTTVKWQSEDTVKVNKIPETKPLKHEIKR